MKFPSAIVLLALGAFTATGVQAQHHDSAVAHAAGQAINKDCPVGKEPIDGETFVTFEGHTIGFCCPGCDSQFLAWDETRRAAFVTASLSGDEPAELADQPEEEVAEWMEPYTLTTCAVSGMELGSMGDPVVRAYNGREVRFCCASCIGEFESDMEASFAKVDEQIIKDQLRYYPTDMCVVSGEPLVEDGEDIATNLVVGNRLVRLCCKACKRDFVNSPEQFLKKLDEEIAAAQRTEYPLEECVVSGGALGSMGKPTEMVIAGRLVRFCCASCEPKVKANPLGFLAKIDAAWQAVGRFMPMAEGLGEAQEAGHDHDG